VKELITAVARDVDIQVTVVIIVAHGHAGSEHPIACDTCFGSYILWEKRTRPLDRRQTDFDDRSAGRVYLKMDLAFDAPASSKLARILRRALGSPHLLINRRCLIMPKAIRFNQLGGPEVLHIEDQPERQPGPDEVLLKVEAVGLNRAESMYYHGLYMEKVNVPSGIGYEAVG
jgi:hypothetical protein